jgi:hypothetical protein
VQERAFSVFVCLLSWKQAADGRESDADDDFRLHFIVRGMTGETKLSDGVEFDLRTTCTLLSAPSHRSTTTTTTTTTTRDALLHKD